jgi:hypothetical protein
MVRDAATLSELRTGSAKPARRRLLYLFNYAVISLSKMS